MYFSKKKERQLVKMYPNTDDRDIARILGIPLWIVEKTANELGLEKEEDNEWSKKEIEMLENIYPHTSSIAIASVLRKDHVEVEHFAYRMGLKKTESYFDSVKDTEQDKELINAWEDEYDHTIHGGSRGNYVLGKALKFLFPMYRIEPEFPIGGLRLDWYVHEIKLGFEFDGIQHFEHVAHFHKTKGDFHRAQQRDYDKSEMCEKMGITVVRFAYDEKLTLGFIKAKIQDVTFMTWGGK